MHEPIRLAAQRKGGRIKVRKGLGSMDQKKARAIQSLGGKAKHENYINRKGAIQTQVSGGENQPIMEQLLNDLEATDE